MRRACLMLCFAACAKGPGAVTTLGASAGDGATATSGGATGTDGSASAGSTSSAGASTSSGAGASSGSSSGAACPAAAVLSALGRDHFLIGYKAGPDTTASAPFDLRYEYLSSGVPDGGVPCAQCDASCTIDGVAGQWWGCYYNADYLAKLKTAASGATLMLTYYQLYTTALAKQDSNSPTHDSAYNSFSEGFDEITIAANDVALMTALFNDWRYALQRVGNATMLLHFEPDFWGYAEQYAISQSKTAHQISAAISAANPADCADQEDSIAGFGRCVIAMTRKYAPHALISLHASGWATGPDVFGNKDTMLDVAAEGAKVAAFLKDCGQGEADLMVSDFTNADADYYIHFANDHTHDWDATNATLPNFHQGWAFAQALTQGLGQPLLWWQVPVGNAGLSDQLDATCSANRYAWNGNATFKDNRVDYFFAHLDEVIASGAIGVTFGAALACDTTFETDGGNLNSRMQTYADGGFAAVCPAR